MSTNIERTFILSGRNTIIHKLKKNDLIIVNGDEDPVVKVSHTGISVYEYALPKNRREAKEQYVEVLQVTAPEVFGERKTLLFVQSLDNREYKIDYSKVGTNQFVSIHQDSYL